MAYEPVLIKDVREPGSYTLDFYVKNGRGYEGLKKALTLKPNDIIEQVKASGLRGRGGAGFPTGLKWQFVLKDTPKPKYIACNADESEPGTFKDHVLMERNPHLLIEGCAIGCYAIDVLRASGASRIFACDIRQARLDLALSLGASDAIFDVARELEQIALKDEYFIEKKLYPNVDFYSGIILSAIGFPTDMFTALFALARTVGWVAQWNEMISDPEQKIGRPRQLYVGEAQRDYVAVDKRG